MIPTYNPSRHFAFSYAVFIIILETAHADYMTCCHSEVTLLIELETGQSTAM